MKAVQTLLSTAFAMALSFGAAAHAASVEWVCSTGGSRQLAQTSTALPEGSEVGAVVAKRVSPTRAKPVSRVTRDALLKALKGDALWTGDDFLVVYLLPAKSPETIAAIRDLGVVLAPDEVAQVAETLARPGGLVDRYIRIVRPSEMPEKISQRHPSAGVMPVGSDLKPCF